jgi:inositol oxygenase
MEPALRRYDDETVDTVRAHYAAMHRGQTLECARAMRARFDPATGGVGETLGIADAIACFTYHDDADPDFDADNLLHCYQTAEACRQAFPDRDWLHLVGLLHDLGKAPLARAGLPQWSIGGDIYPLGCAFDESNVFPETFAGNPDAESEELSSATGIYDEGCGFEQVVFAFGHDQYLYDVLVAHGDCRIPRDGLYLIRFHSFYPWHQHGGYARLASQSDHRRLGLLRAFQRCDLYSKIEDLPDPAVLWPYYEGLIERYCPGRLRW